MHAIGPIFECRGPALKSDYNGNMLTPADMKRQVERFYERQRKEKRMMLNEEHTGKKWEIGEVLDMWVDHRNQLMVHLRFNPATIYGMERINQLKRGEPVGLSLEMTREYTELTNGSTVVNNKKIFAIATTDTPDHNTYIEHAETTKDDLFKKAFVAVYGPHGDTDARPLKIRNDLKKQIQVLFDDGVADPSAPVDTAPTNPIAVPSEVEAEAEVEAEVEAAATVPVTQEEESVIGPESIGESEIEAPVIANNTNVDNFNDASSKMDPDDGGDGKQHSIFTSDPMDNKKIPDETATPNDQVSEIEMLRAQNAQLEADLKRRRDDMEVDANERTKKQKTEEGYALTARDKLMSLEQATRTYAEYLKMQGIKEEATPERAMAFLNQKLEKKKEKAMRTMEAFNSTLRADLESDANISPEEREAILRVANDSSNPEAAVATRALAAMVAHRGALASHRQQESAFQASQRQSQIGMSASLKAMTARQPAVSSSLYSNSMRHVQTVLNRGHSVVDSMELDEPTPAPGPLGIGSKQANAEMEDRNAKILEVNQQWQPTVKQVMSPSQTHDLFGGLQEKYGHDCLNAGFVPRMNPHTIGDEDPTIQRLYSYFQQTPVAKAMGSISGKAMQLMPRMSNPVGTWQVVSGTPDMFDQ